MMAATNQSSLNKSEIDFLEENLENCSVENRSFVGYFDGKTFEGNFVKTYLIFKGISYKGKHLENTLSA